MVLVFRGSSISIIGIAILIAVPIFYDYMACTCGDDKCKFKCQLLKNSADVVSIDHEWLLNEKLY